MLKPEKIKSCPADRDEGGSRVRVFGPNSLSGSVLVKSETRAREVGGE